MASKISTPLGMAAILLIILGVIMLIVGIILLVINQNVEKAWYIWLILSLGAVFAVAGGIMLAFALQPETHKMVQVRDIDY
jgi:uncharacterized membrane protein HdeD (DUF308 family)